MTRNELKKWLSKYMEFVHDSEDFRQDFKDCIWVSGESQEEYNASVMYSYYAQGKAYEFGVLIEWEKQLNQRGWYSQWYDCGTIILCKL